MENQFFFYGVSKDNRRVTVAGILENNTIKLNKAECSNKDTFTRKKGRSIALGRANKKPLQTVIVPEGVKAGQLFVESAKALI